MRNARRVVRVVDRRGGRGSEVLKLKMATCEILCHVRLELNTSMI